MTKTKPCKISIVRTLNTKIQMGPVRTRVVWASRVVVFFPPPLFILPHNTS